MSNMTKNKLQKAKARRKDYELRRNINRNVPSISHLVSVELLENKKGKDNLDKNGRALVRVVGRKEVVEKVKRFKLGMIKGEGKAMRIDRSEQRNPKAGMIEYPKSRKYPSFIRKVTTA